MTWSGEPVCDIESSRTTKRPYEMLILGRTMTAVHTDDATQCDDARTKQLPDHRVIVSVPCSIHSRKPPLAGQCRPILSAQDYCTGWRKIK